MALFILKIAIILIIGYIGGRVAKRFNLPAVSGYLLFGLVLGPSMSIIFKGFEGVITSSDQTTLKFISEIALSFIAFSIGSEFNIKKLKKEGTGFIKVTNYEVLFAILTVFVILFFIPKPEPVMIGGYNPFSKGNIAFGLVLASMSIATAPAATLMVMRQYKAYGPLTKMVLPVVALDDIYGIVVFGFFISFAGMLTTGAQMATWLIILKPFIEVIGSLLIGFVISYILVKLLNKITASEDYQILSIIAVMLTTGIILVINNKVGAYNISMSALLANMMVGTMVANLANKPDKSFESVNHFITPFYVLFFTLAGASLDLNILKTNAVVLALSVAYIFSRGFGKYIGAFIGAHRVGMPKKARNYIGFTLLPQGGVSLGLLVVVAAQMGDFYPLISTIIMLSILVYETTGPIFAKFAITRAGEAEGLEDLDVVDF